MKLKLSVCDRMSSAKQHQIVRAAIDQYLSEHGSYECETEQGRDPSAELPSLLDLVQTWLLSREDLLSSLTPLNAVLIPDHPTRSFESVHAGNILSLQVHTLIKRSFDTQTAEYVDRCLPCVVSTAVDRNICFTNLDTEEREEILHPSKNVILCTACFQNLIASGSMDGSLHVVDLVTHETIFTVRNHIKYIVRILFSDVSLAVILPCFSLIV